MIRQQVVAHGKREVLVTFEVDGEPRNHLLRDAAELNEELREHEEATREEFAVLETAQRLDREKLLQRQAADRDRIAAKAFEQAELEMGIPIT